MEGHRAGSVGSETVDLSYNVASIANMVDNVFFSHLISLC